MENNRCGNKQCNKYDEFYKSGCFVWTCVSVVDCIDYIPEEDKKEDKNEFCS